MITSDYDSNSDTDSVIIPNLNKETSFRLQTFDYDKDKDLEFKYNKNYLKLINKYKIDLFWILKVRDNMVYAETSMVRYKLYMLESSLTKFLYGSKKYRNNIRKLELYYFNLVEYFELQDVLNFIPNLNTHPEHYNIRKMLETNKTNYEILKTFNKKTETLLLSKINEELGDKYAIIYQKKINEFNVDTLIHEITDFTSDIIPGIIIEIDEDDHKLRNAQDEIIREKIIELHGHRVIRIPVKVSKIKKYCNNEQLLNEFLKEYILEIDILLKDQYLVAATKINFNDLNKMIESKNIGKDFFEIVGKSLSNDKNKYNIHIDDIALYVEYNSSRDLINALRKKNLENKFYIEYSNDEYLIFNKDSVVNKFATRKIHWLFNRRGFYEVLLLINKPKAKQAVRYFIDIYELALDYFRMITIAKNNAIQHTRNNIPVIAEKEKLTNNEYLSKIKLQNIKHSKIIERKDRIIKSLESKAITVSTNNFNLEQLKEKKQNLELQETLLNMKEMIWKTQILLYHQKNNQIINNSYPSIQVNPKKHIKCIDLYNKINPDIPRNQFYCEIENIFNITKTKIGSINIYIGITL